MGEEALEDGEAAVLLFEEVCKFKEEACAGVGLEAKSHGEASEGGGGLLEVVGLCGGSEPIDGGVELGADVWGEGLACGGGELEGVGGGGEEAMFEAVAAGGFVGGEGWEGRWMVGHGLDWGQAGGWCPRGGGYHKSEAERSEGA
jgi:hypothetical protein